jgi:diguanylate cyclase (GGDEF)-like protein
VKRPDIPENEQKRLAALRSLYLLDTPPDERFDRLTRIARRIFRVPIALISLIDLDRQWFKSSAGLDASESPRELSFCGHAINGRDVFIVPDASQDERFADNPLVTGPPDIRFYAGCPLSLDNLPLGTLCIIDQQPRILSSEEIEALKDLASIAEHELTALQLASHDELTDLSNRRGFLQLAQHSLYLCARQNIPASLAFLDLDLFKPINDTFGHEEGDRALISFSHLMKSQCRDTDICARMGGDEFVILLADADRDQAEEVIRRLCRSLQAYNKEANRGYTIKFSHGIVEFQPERHQTITELLAVGDALMYEDKRSKGEDFRSMSISTAMPEASGPPAGSKSAAELQEDSEAQWIDFINRFRSNSN